MSLADYTEYIEQPNPETKLWRYMDFAKFMALIHSSSLFFTQLKRFEDPFEGSMQWIVREAKKGSDFEQEMMQYFSHPKNLRAFCAVSCWHMNEFESAAMWKLYLSSNQGIAIQTTIQHLMDSLLFDTNNYHLYKGAVLYDGIREPSPGTGYGGELALFCKRPSFSHEREYRILLSAPKFLPLLDANGGLSISVNLEALIDKIFVAPTTPAWISSLIASVLEEKYSLHKPIEQSDLNRNPLW